MEHLPSGQQHPSRHWRLLPRHSFSNVQVGGQQLIQSRWTKLSSHLSAEMGRQGSCKSTSFTSKKLVLQKVCKFTNITASIAHPYDSSISSTRGSFEYQNKPKINKSTQGLENKKTYCMLESHLSSLEQGSQRGNRLQRIRWLLGSRSHHRQFWTGRRQRQNHARNTDKSLHL